jgi:hypothetical protein
MQTQTRKSNPNDQSVGAEEAATIAAVDSEPIAPKQKKERIRIVPREEAEKPKAMVIRQSRRFRQFRWPTCVSATGTSHQSNRTLHPSNPTHKSNHPSKENSVFAVQSYHTFDGNPSIYEQT